MHGLITERLIHNAERSRRALLQPGAPSHPARTACSLAGPRRPQLPVATIMTAMSQHRNDDDGALPQSLATFAPSSSSSRCGTSCCWYHIFCSGPGRTVPLAVCGSTSVAELQLQIQDALGLPACEQLLVHQGRCLLQDAAATTLARAGVGVDATVQVHLRLRGGKGGFGALLRGQGRDGKITDNYDACRDLSGRRLRHVQAEKKLKAWQAEAKERELEKVALQHMKQMAKDQKRQKEQQETEEEVKEQQRRAAAAVHDAINEALATAGGSSDSSQSAGDGLDGSPPTAPAAAAAAGAKRPAAAAAGRDGDLSAAAKRRKPGMMAVLDSVSSDDDDESGSESE